MICKDVVQSTATEKKLRSSLRRFEKLLKEEGVTLEDKQVTIKELENKSVSLGIDPRNISR